MKDAHVQIVHRIKQGDTLAFEEIFNQWYPPLVNFARSILKDGPLAEEQVQEIFTRLWIKRHDLSDDLVLFPYLLTSVRNKCINIIQHQSVHNKFVSQAQREYQSQILNYDYADINEELIENLHRAINKLPDRCRDTFMLSRFHGLSHREIADQLGISTKTVENQITKALKVLKHEMLSKIYFSIICIGGLWH